LSTIGHGYGSEWHLLRMLGYHRDHLTRAVEITLGATDLRWLDFPFNARRKSLDDEWKGVNFIRDDSLQQSWHGFWPQTGNLPNWDAVGSVAINGTQEWLLVEAKGHLGEIKSTCKAQIQGGRLQIVEALRQTMDAAGADVPVANWLRPYYQFANRLAALNFLRSHGIGARLLFIYFVRDKRPHDSSICPAVAEEWEPELRLMYNHLGLTGESEIERRVHKLFLNVDGRNAER